MRAANGKTILSGLVMALSCASTAHAGIAPEGIIRTGDASLTCPQIILQATEATSVMGGSPEVGLMASEHVIGAATSLAMQGALHSGAARSIPGIGMAGSLLGGLARANRERQEQLTLEARQRWYYLNGLYSGRDCDGVAQQATRTEPMGKEAPPSPKS